MKKIVAALFLLFFAPHAVALEIALADFNESARQDGLSVIIIEPKESSFSRVSAVKFLVRVKDSAGNDATGASVNLVAPQKRIVPLPEVSVGLYSGLLEIPADAETGEQVFAVSAGKNVNGVPLAAESIFSATIENAAIDIGVILPKEKFFRIGDTISVSFTAKYKNNGQLSSPLPAVSLSGVKIDVARRETGVFEAQYKIPLGLSGKTPIIFSVSDAFGNTGVREFPITVESENIIAYFLKTDPVIVLIALLFLAGAFFSQAIRMGKKNAVGELSARRKVLLNSIAEAQRLFYRENRIDRQEYQKLLGEYSAEVEKIDSLLEKNKKK